MRHWPHTLTVSQGPLRRDCRTHDGHRAQLYPPPPLPSIALHANESAKPSRKDEVRDRLGRCYVTL